MTVTATDIDAGLLLLVEGDRYSLTVLPPGIRLRGRFLLAKEGGRTYEVTVAPDGSCACQCDSFVYRNTRTRKRWKGSCRHVEALKKVGLIRT